MPLAAAYRVEKYLANEEATLAFGGALSAIVKIGDFVGLSGDLGAGKTSLARGVVRALCPAEPPLEVVSPTFTLVQTYDGSNFAITHVDLYRVEHAAELEELGLEDALEDGILLVEWPDRLGSRLPDDRLMIDLAIASDGRRATLTGFGGWSQRVQADDELGTERVQ